MWPLLINNPVLSLKAHKKLLSKMDISKLKNSSVSTCNVGVLNPSDYASVCTCTDEQIERWWFVPAVSPAHVNAAAFILSRHFLGF